MKALLDIPINIDRSWGIFVGLVSVMAFLSGGMLGLFTQVVPLITVYFVVVLHEYGHAWAALKCGLRVREIKVWLLGGLAYIEGNHYLSNKDDFFISFAGPAVNAILAVPAVVLMVLGFTAYPIVFFAGINIVLFLFNMLPAYPMDGGRILRAALSFKFSPRTAERLTYKTGQVMAVLMLGAGIGLRNIFLILISAYVFYFCYKSLKGEPTIFDKGPY